MAILKTYININVYRWLFREVSVLSACRPATRKTKLVAITKREAKNAHNRGEQKTNFVTRKELGE